MKWSEEEVNAVLEIMVNNQNNRSEGLKMASQKVNRSVDVIRSSWNNPESKLCKARRLNAAFSPAKCDKEEEKSPNNPETHNTDGDGLVKPEENEYKELIEIDAVNHCDRESCAPRTFPSIFHKLAKWFRPL